ncbi:hypothetical protein BDR26DRAFT_801917 [Obelidium mucronatum]|nr:hypothetical protein BDR26DRAFT_801917 [Obelidium mucronatum]
MPSDPNLSQIIQKSYKSQQHHNLALLNSASQSAPSTPASKLHSFLPVFSRSTKCTNSGSSSSSIREYQVEASAAGSNPAPSFQQQHTSKCSNCSVTKTPVWRRDGTNGAVLCNACGLYFKMHKKHRPLGLKKGAKDDKTDILSIEEDDEQKCFQCGITKTPVWRRDAERRRLCNSCGLYRKLTGLKRPVELNRGTQQRRKRGIEKAKN